MGTLRQRNLFVKNAPLIQEEVLKSADTVKMVVSRGREEEGEQQNTHTNTHTLPNTSFNLKNAYFQGIHLACSHKTIYSVEVHTLPRHVKIEAYSVAKPTLSGLNMAYIYIFCHSINQK